MPIIITEPLRLFNNEHKVSIRRVIFSVTVLRWYEQLNSLFCHLVVYQREVDNGKLTAVANF